MGIIMRLVTKEPKSSAKAYSRTYGIWSGMRQRCSNPNATNYFRYGAKGIKVCEAWSKYDQFILDMGEPPTPRHTLDRIDPNGDYTPENCRWADMETQFNNKRNNVNITAFGKTQTLAQWVRETGLSRDMIKHRIFEMNLTPEEALNMQKGSWVQKPVLQYDLQGNFVQRYESLAATEKATGLSKKAIHLCLVGKNKSSCGFYWEYENQNQ